MSKIALVIIYNHQYNENIEVLERIYKPRFTNIYHLVPFYQGEKKNVIAVYENSYYFQGYIAQGAQNLLPEEFTHYFFIADDLILNPKINENNLTELFKLGSKTSFLTGYVELHEVETFWNSVNEAYNYSINCPGVEVKNQIPSQEEALRRFKHFGLSTGSLHYDQLFKRDMASFNNLPKFRVKKGYISDLMIFIPGYIKSLHSELVRSLNKNKKYFLKYPIVGSYSDICIVSAHNFKLFAHYCGIFAVTRLFVELAIPTALVLSAEEIITEKDIRLKGKAIWSDGSNPLNGEKAPSKGDFSELLPFKNSLKSLLENFPEDYIYLHPIKLSKWETKI